MAAQTARALGRAAGTWRPDQALRDPLGRLNLATFLLSITIYSPILVLFYTGRGLSLFQVLSLEAFMGLAMLLLEVPTGVVADRIGLKRSVALGYAFAALALVPLAALLLIRLRDEEAA